MRRNGFIIEGVNYEVEFTAGSKKAMEYNYVNKYSIAGSIMSVGERLNKMEQNERFIVIDRLFKVGVVCNMDRKTDCVEVLAVVNQDNVFIKDGIEMYEFNKWAQR